MNDGSLFDKNSSMQLSEDQICSLVKVLETLRTSGVAENDERYLTLLRLLKSQNLDDTNTLPLKENHLESNSTLSTGDIEKLQLEIAAYRLLSRNVPLSQKLLSSLCPSIQFNPLQSDTPISYPLDLIVQSKLESRLQELQCKYL